MQGVFGSPFLSDTCGGLCEENILHALNCYMLSVLCKYNAVHNLWIMLIDNNMR